MLKRLENKLMMLKAVQSFLKQNEAAWTGSTILTALVAQLENRIAEIESLRLITESDRTGITAEKRAQQEELIDRAYELSSVLYAMAAGTGNKVLQGKVGFTESDLQSARGSDLVSTCVEIAGLVRTNLSALEPYGVVEADVTALEELNNSFSQNIPAHRVSVAERKAANEKLKELFSETDSLLEEQLDRMMVPYKNSSPDLYAAYTHARSIVHYGIRHEKPENEETR